jgi:DNA-binding transcriptional ArsR family regulator
MKLDLESILSSACRRKIIKFLAENGPSNIMRLVAGVNSKYPQVNSDLKILQKEKIIIDQHVGRIRIIRLNKENPDTGIILQVLKLLHSNGNKNHQQ